MINYSVSDGLCILRLDNPPLNTITFRIIAGLRSAVRRANMDENVHAIVLTGSDTHFSAGADIHVFDGLDSRDKAIEVSRIFQETFDAVEESEKPIVAAVAGQVMGSALEVAAACHFRVCDTATRFSMPEVNLAVVPGAGGTQRITRLVGVGESLTLLLSGRSITAAKAEEVGLVDTVCQPGKLIETARSLVAGMERINRTSERDDKIADPAANEMAFAMAEGRIKEVREEIIAPRKILECVRAATGPFDDGLVCEQQAFADCMDTPAARNKMYLFFAKRMTHAVRGLEHEVPVDVKTVAVVGMGSMGAGIARAMIAGGIRTIVLDEKKEAVEAGEKWIRESIEKRVSSGSLLQTKADQMLNLISTTTEWKDISAVDVVIEAVYENEEIKRKVIADIENACNINTIIASNTSTISLDTLAEGMQNPQRIVGMHFFNPAHHMPLVEVVRRKDTDATVAATVMKLAKTIHKTPVMVENSAGFIVNRIFVPYLKEAFRLIEEGADPRLIDTAMNDFGFPMGPIQLIDMAGLDILLFTDAELRKAFPDQEPVSDIVSRLVGGGHHGQKSGAGVYMYEHGDHTPHDDNPVALEIIAAVRQESGITPRPFDINEIITRLMLCMINEGYRVLGEKIAQRESDIDVATVMGIGFPDFHGGVLKHARDLGLRNVVSKLESRAEQCGARFAPCRLLQKLKGA